MDESLSGLRIAVLVESQYIPGEVAILRERFANYGAEVDLVSRLWGQSSQPFYSTVEPEKEGDAPPLEWIEVTHDVDSVDLADYAAVVATSNYTSVRMRYVDPPPGGASASEAVREAPVVSFMRHAMADPSIVKAAPCHALWLLTASPEVLAGRRVTCNPVVLADVVNAGGIYVPPDGVAESDHVVVDGDLVTTGSWHAAEKMVDTVRDLIVEQRSRSGPLYGHPSAHSQGQNEADLEREVEAKRILVVLSEWGYWGEELVGPLDEFDRVGYTIDFCTPTGKRPNAVPISLQADFFDPPLQRPVTSAQMAERTSEFDDPATPQGARLEKPIDLSQWFPQRPYHASPQFVRQLEIYHRELAEAEKDLHQYDALLIVGGSGPIVDLANNQRLHDMILGFYRSDKPIAAECYGVTCLAFARDMNERQSIIAGKHVTGHCLEYDYKDGYGFVEARGQFLDFNMGPVPYPLEFILSDATGPGGGFHGNFGHATSVVVDHPFITGRSTSDGYLTGQKLIEVLEHGLRRWGW